jgi:hypothetical protein
MRRALLVVLVASFAACNRKPKDEAPCGTVAGRLFTLATDDLGKATVEPVTRRRVADQLPAMRDALTQLCTDGHWSAAARNCMANAVDHAAFQTCQQQLTDDQRKALDRHARGETATH